MFSSLKPWTTVDVVIKPFKGYSASADKLYGDEATIKAYVVGGVEVTNDKQGNQVASTTQFYFDPNVYTVNPEDRVIIEGQEKDIISISTWYDGNDGSKSIKQVFL